MKLKIYGRNLSHSRDNGLFSEDFRLLIAGPTGCGKTNTLMNILLIPLTFYDRIYIFTNTPEQDKIVDLQNQMAKLSARVGYEILQVFPPSQIGFDYPQNSRKVVVFDDLLHEAPKIQEQITKHFTLGRHQKISPIYLSQSYFGTPIQIRLNCSHMILYPPTTTKHINLIGKETMVDPEMFSQLKPFDFLFLNRNKKTVAKNFDEPL